MSAVDAMQQEVDAMGRLQAYMEYGNRAWKPFFLRLKQIGLAPSDMGSLAQHIAPYDVASDKREELVEEIACRYIQDPRTHIKDHVQVVMSEHVGLLEADIERIADSLYAESFDFDNGRRKRVQHDFVADGTVHLLQNGTIADCVDEMLELEQRDVDMETAAAAREVDKMCEEMSVASDDRAMNAEYEQLIDGVSAVEEDGGSESPVDDAVVDIREGEGGRRRQGRWRRGGRPAPSERRERSERFRTAHFGEAQPPAPPERCERCRTEYNGPPWGVSDLPPLS